MYLKSRGSLLSTHREPRLFVFLIEYDFTRDDLFDLRLDGIHHAHPSHWISRFQIFIDTRLCCHPRDHLIQQMLCFCIHFVQIVIQLSAEEQSAVQPRPMLFQNLHPCSAEFAERLTAFNFKIGEIVITNESIVQSVCAVVDSGRECVHGVSSLSCGVGHNVLLQPLTVCSYCSPFVV